MGSLEDSAAHLPLCFHELTPWHRSSIAAVREAGGLELSRPQKADLAEASEIEKALICSDNKPAIELASALSKQPKHSGVVYRGVGLDPIVVDAWVRAHPVGLMLSDPTFVSCSLKLNVALKYGSTMLIRMRSCSGVEIGPISTRPQDKEVVFAPGEQFIIVRQGQHRLRKSPQTIWVLDVEDVSWPAGPIPIWQDYPLPGKVLSEVFLPGARRSASSPAK